VAVPAPFVVAVPATPPSTENATSAPTTGEEVSVRVSVALNVIGSIRPATNDEGAGEARSSAVAMNASSSAPVSQADPCGRATPR
jgi:hypothetical protein